MDVLTILIIGVIGVGAGIFAIWMNSNVDGSSNSNVDGSSRAALKENLAGVFGGAVLGLLVGGAIGGASELFFGSGLGTGLLVGLVLGVLLAVLAWFVSEADGSARDIRDTDRSAPQSGRAPTTDLLFEESAGGLEKDTSARFVVPEREDEQIRFECSEFQTPISTKRTDMFFYYARLQNFEPVHVAVHGSKEWWWFRGGFYKVEFEEGQPSAGLAADIAVDDWPDKTSLALDPDADRQGYSPDEVAEGVFEMMDKTETGAEYADRLDMAHAITAQVAEASTQKRLVEEQDRSSDYGVERDESARVFAEKSWMSTRVCIESNAHRPPETLVKDDAQFELAAKIQRYHPVLVDKKVGQGRLWKSQIVVEWWWFKDNVYIAKRERGYQSEALSQLKEKSTPIQAGNRLVYVQGKSQAWIPKLTLGNEIQDRYDEGYAPEEVAQLVFTEGGGQETLDAMFDRIQAAKNILDQYPMFQKPWDGTRDALNREQYEEYLQEKKENDYRGYLEAKRGDYWGNFKQWDRQWRKEFWSRTRERDSTGSPKITGTYSVGSTPRREHIPKSVKIHVWQRDGGRCANCGSNEKLEYDHIIPLSKGGSNTERNIQLLCERCNRHKGASIS